MKYFKILLAISIIWAVLVGMIGYPNTILPDGSLWAGAVVSVVAIATAPFLVVLGWRFISRRKIESLGK